MVDEKAASNEMIKPGFPPVGARIIKQEGLNQARALTVPFKGISYCRAVMEAGQGQRLLIGPGCIEVCRWSPAVLGLKTPESAFEKELEPRLPLEVKAIVLSRLDDWPPKIGDPEVVIIRGDHKAMKGLLSVAGPESVFHGSSGVDKTAVPLLTGETGHPLKSAMVSIVNRGLDLLNRFPWWTEFTVWAFRRESTSRALNFLLDRTMANMSVCRNSTVIPLLTGMANVSHFCTGGITWGRNPPHFLTCGVPYGMYRELEDKIAPA